MSNKVLIPQTIIPQHLYVYRDADRDMEFLLKDMGRPGYVLVARQMGKTNLLLNAKRNFISLNDASVYVDFSNVFRSARECFRYIIDLIVETNYDKLYFINESIKKSRQENDLADHLEHELELRKILEALKGKLIIIIDEVDAITTVDFSDTIFKQIRSTYFSGRTNFPILKNLTYILSGVGEPSNLIKDPKISPFNIGQEIFLGDFSFREYRDFLSKSKLEITDSAADRIYYWTNGNPRMTYEICSAVEDVIQDNEGYAIALDADSVDAIVHRMYLVAFDKVPLDNIRGMVQADAEMLSAIKYVKSGNLTQITAAQRRKLYLAGIVGADFETDKIYIKNRIIDKALSDEWLQEITKDDGAIGRAATAFSNKKYAEVIELLEDKLGLYQSEEQFAALQQMLVFSYYNRFKFKDIIKHFETYGLGLKQPLPKVYGVYKMQSLYSYALSLYYNKKYSVVADVLQQLLLVSDKGEFYFNSLLVLAHLASNNYFLPKILDGVDLISFYAKVVNDVDEVEDELPFEGKQHFKAIAFYSLGLLHKERGNKSLAFDSFKNSLNVASNLYRAVILYNMALVSSATNDRGYLEKSLSAIISTKAKIQNYSFDVPVLISYSVVFGLIDKLKSINRNEVMRLINYVYDEELKGSFPKMEELYSVLSREDILAREQIILVSFTDFVDNLSTAQIKHGYYAFKASNILSVNLSKYFVEPAIRVDIIEEFDEVDALQMLMAIRSYLLTNMKFVSLTAKYIRNNYADLEKKDSIEYIVLNYYEMQAAILFKQQKEAFFKAEVIVEAFKKIDINRVEYPYIDKETILDIRSGALNQYTSMLGFFKPSIDVKEARSFPDRSRQVTVMYSDGKTVTDKFKRFEKDIARGKCQVLPV